MALVDYASSSEDEDVVSHHAQSVLKTTHEGTSGLKRKSEAQHDLPPLPSKFHDLYASNVRTTTYDDPTLHGGRKRIKPHVEGNWPTHLYIEWWPQARDLETLSKLISSFSSSGEVEVKTLLESELGAPLPLHISLSRSLTLTLQNKTSFLSRVQSAMKATAISAFSVKPWKCTWVSNYEKTRWFLVISIARPPGDELNKLLQTCNAVAAEFGQPALYDSSTFEASTPALVPANAESDKIFDRSEAFHISIAWTLSPPATALVGAAQAWRNDEDKIPPFEVKDIKAKIGNAVTSIPLKSAKPLNVGKKSLFSV